MIIVTYFDYLYAFCSETLDFKYSSELPERNLEIFIFSNLFFIITET